MALEGLRGVAAAIVVIRHTFNATPMPIEQRRSLLEGLLAPLLNAQGSVQVFFILSGFVLAGSLSRSRRALDTLQYLTKRVFRIHPPYMAAVFAAWCLSFFYLRGSQRTGMTRWAARGSIAPPEAGEVLQSMLFPGDAFGLLTVGWTLEIEMILSLLLPLLLWFSLRTHWSLLVGLSLIPLWFGALPLPMLYAFDFCLGIALFSERERVVSGLAQIPTLAGIAIFIASVVLFVAPQLLGWHRPGLGILIPGVGDPASITVTSTGALGLIALALRVGWWARFLETRPVLFVGRISYSLYLLHLPLTVVCLRFAPSGGGIGAWLSLLAVVSVLTMPLAALMHRFIELPAIRAGNRACRHLASKTHSDALPSADPM